MSIIGEATCKWNNKSWLSDENFPDRYKNVTFSGHEVFLRNVSFLFGGEKIEPGIKMGPGSYSFKFSHLLPINIPTSFESNGGKVKYYVEATFFRITRIGKLKAKMQFTVATYLDLNLYPSLRIPAEEESLSTFCCMFYRSETLQISCRIPQTGYVMGEKVEVTLEINNATSNEIENTSIQLIQVVKFLSKYPNIRTKLYYTMIDEQSGEGVTKFATKQLQKSIILPNVTQIRYCETINVSYEIRVSGQMNGAKFPAISIPFEIGTVALSH
jgi:hypothetical protein